MLFIEFQTELHSGLNMLKYKEVGSDVWYYMHMDVETLHLLIRHFGVISTLKVPTQWTNCDNPSTSTAVQVKYCGAPIQFFCGKRTTKFNVADLEQNY